MLAILALAGRAEAGNVEDARAYLEKATGEYALYKYAAAAEHFEKAFELKPDPALLYDAAQSYRLAGNKERAFALYESYLRVYPNDKRRPEIEAHIKQLRLAIDHDRAPARSPRSATAADAVVPSDVRTPQLSAMPPMASSQVMLTPSADVRPSDEPLTKKKWFWVAVSGGVAVAAIVGVLLASAGSNPASPSLGRVSGN